MAMNPTTWGQLIKSKIQALGVVAGVDVDIDALYQALAEAHYEHITGNAVIPAGITLTTPDTVNGATTGTGIVT
jgi:hypothetical protein